MLSNANKYPIQTSQRNLPVTTTGQKATFGSAYDAVNRLTNAQAACPADPTRSYEQAYTYDLAGNILQQTGKNAYQVVEQDSVGRPTRIDYSPEIADIGTRHVDYNQDDMPVHITFKGQETTITYDGEDTRIKKVSATSTVIYIGGVYEIRDGAPLLHIFANGKRIATVEGSGMHYFHTDHLSSTTVVTDQTGLEVEEMGYLPFGALLYDNVRQGGQWRSVFRFTGQEYDAEFALYNYNARLYDPIMGRFISPDHIMQDYYNPQNLNRYAYCINNPLIYVDPTGHFFFGMSFGFGGSSGFSSSFDLDFGYGKLSAPLSGGFSGGTRNSVWGRNAGDRSGHVKLGTVGVAAYQIYGGNITFNYMSTNLLLGMTTRTCPLDAFRQAYSMIAGEAEDFDAGRMIADTLENIMKRAGVSFKSGFLETLGGRPRFNAIRDPIYNSLVDKSFSQALASVHSEKIKGAIAGFLSPLDTSRGAYFWNATYQRHTDDIGFNWSSYNKGILVITNETKETTFFKYNPDPVKNPDFSRNIWP
jgi:RHS repeat-associated protein